MTTPEKLKSGDLIRVIAPSHSLSVISQENLDIARKRFEELGLMVSFGKHVNEMNEFKSASIKSRIEDLHDAFSDTEVKAVFCIMGGFNSNQLLRHIDWDIIANNPKIFCGYSDITALSVAMFSKTNLITYSAPVYASFSEINGFDYTLDYVRKCLFSDQSFQIVPSSQWSDDEWYIDQKKRNFIKNSGPVIINKGDAEGAIIGPNLCTLNLLQGTEYFPQLNGAILFLEDDHDSKPENFDRDLQSLLHVSEFKEVKGIVIGRFQKQSQISVDVLMKIIKTKKELDRIPVIANVDFGHTQPMITFPIGGVANISASDSISKLEIVKH